MAKQPIIPVLLAGNCLAVMVAAVELIRKHVPVIVVNDGNIWGGHFGSIQTNDAEFDCGMVLLEFTSYNSQPKINDCHSYNPWIRNDAGRFVDIVKNYISKFVDTHEIELPKMLYEGRIYDDIMISNQIKAVTEFPFSSQVLMELSGAWRNSPLHARNKHGSAVFANLTFDIVSVFNHGKTLHNRLFEPFCRKLLNHCTHEVLAPYHRVPWLPLFHPETLVAVLNGEQCELPKTRFHYPVNNGVSEFVKNLYDALVNNPYCTIIDAPIRSIDIEQNSTISVQLHDHASICCSNLGWGKSSEQLMRALGIHPKFLEYKKCSIAILYAQVAATQIIREFTVLNVIDDNYAVYRITNQTLCAASSASMHNLVVEFNPDYLRSISADRFNFNDDMISAVLFELVVIGVISDISAVINSTVKEMKNALMLPNRNNLEFCVDTTRLIQNVAPSISMLGPSSGFFSSSFNDQIVQGLKLADELGGFV